MPPWAASIPNIEALCSPSDRSMSLSDWPSFHQAQSSRFGTVNLLD